MQSVAEYAPEIMDQLFHDEGIFMPRVNYMVARIAKGKTCRCCLISGYTWEIEVGQIIHKPNLWT